MLPPHNLLERMNKIKINEIFTCKNCQRCETFMGREVFRGDRGESAMGLVFCDLLGGTLGLGLELGSSPRLNSLIECKGL